MLAWQSRAGRELFLANDFRNPFNNLLNRRTPLNGRKFQLQLLDPRWLHQPVWLHVRHVTHQKRSVNLRR